MFYLLTSKYSTFKSTLKQKGLHQYTSIKKYRESILPKRYYSIREFGIEHVLIYYIYMLSSKNGMLLYDILRIIPIKIELLCIV